MKNISKILTLSAMALALGACSNIERSRNLDDAKVSGNTLAQQVCSTCHGLNGQSINPHLSQSGCAIERLPLS